MQKKIIALAIAGLASSAAFAQSNVTIYGRMDYGFMVRGGGSGMVDTASRKDEMSSGIQSGSRIGFKGSEDLGNGTKAIWQVEQGLTNDYQNATSTSATSGAAANVNHLQTGSGIFNGLSRNAFLGLTGNWGTAVGGRLDGVRYGIYNKYDAFAGGGMGNFTQMTLQVDRADNAIAYVSPNWSGFTLTLAHARDTAGNEYGPNSTTVAAAGTASSQNVVGSKALIDANTTDGRLYTIMGNYENGPWSLSADWETIRYNNHNDSRPTAAQGGASALEKETVWTLAGSYNFGFMKVAALYDRHNAPYSRNVNPGFGAGRGDGIDYSAWFLSASVPYGNFLFKFTYGRVYDDRNTQERAALRGSLVEGDASKWGIGLNYNLSKRTNLYADYGSINNDRTANYTISPAANAMGGSASSLFPRGSGYGTYGWNVGLAHNF